MLRNSALFLLVISFTFILSSCKKKNKCTSTTSDVVASASEIQAIQTYLTANGLTATQDATGFFYSISDNGSGSSPSLCANISVQYKGSLFNGSVFDESTTTVTFPLNNLIEGWKRGIPLVQKGGKIRLYIPPSLGYGSSAQPGIPANSTLIFDIYLVTFQE